MNSIMMRGSIANSASKDRMSASATMLLPIHHKSVMNQSRESMQHDTNFEESPRNLNKNKAKKPPMSQSLMPTGSKGTARRKGKNQLLLSSSLATGGQKPRAKQNPTPMEALTPVMKIGGVRRKEMVNGRYVNPQAI